MYERIADFALKNTVTTTLALARKQSRTTKTGNPYLHLDLSDKTGKIAAKVWDQSRSTVHWDNLEVGKVYLFTGKVEEFQEERQMSVDDIQEILDFDKKDFIAAVEEDIEELKTEFFGYMKQVENPFLQKLFDAIFTEEMLEKFFEAPAAKTVHDATLGGLLRHTVRITRLALELHRLYPDIKGDKDLIIAGCLFHDMEKTTELFWDTTIGYTHTGQLIGHASLAIMKIHHTIQSIKDFPKDLGEKLIHIVASHAAEHDPIRLPGIPEALIVHYADLTESQLVQFAQEWKRNSGNGWKKNYFADRWSYYPNYEEETE